MDRSGEKGEKEVDVMVVETGNSPVTGVQGSRRRAVRRCTQEKLVFGGSPGGGEDREEDGSEEGEGERKWKRKGKGKPAAAKKASPIRKDLHGLSKASDFFTKVSDKRLQQKKGKVALDSGALTSRGNDCCEVLQSSNVSKSCRKPKRCDGDSTPSKDMANILKGPCSKRKLANDKSQVVKIAGSETVDSCQPVLDLWLEAKTAAEENQRLFAGRQIHPFFTSRKVMKGASETSEIAKAQNKCHTVLNDSFPPLHVTDTLQDNSAPLNWSKWVFSGKSLLGLDSHSLESSSLPNFENYIEPLKFDSVSIVPYLRESLSPQKEILLLDEATDLSSRSEATPSPLPNREEVDGQPVISINGSIDLPIRCDISADNTGEQQEKKFKRLMPCQHGHENCTGHNLWTNKYQPEKASEVCGNTEAVNFINEWLKSWHEKGLQTCKNNGAGKRTMTIDISDGSSHSDSDVEIEDEGSQLRNVLLVTGPVGSGKSAAIYACAKEQGFEVIEVNASDQRNGALIKQKFGEAAESHGLDIRSIDDRINQGKNLEFNLALHDTIADKEFQDDDAAVVSGSCKQDIRAFGYSGGNLENKTTVCQVTAKSLILFEDVDTIFDEDRGFIGTILQLAETSKRPIILTANCKDPVLPQVLEREVVDFRLPSHEELFSLVSMICAMEGSHFSSSLLKGFVDLCQADIRKTITHLQFWCQGQRELGRNKHIYSHLKFDLDAAHLVLPGIIPWGFPCKLSEKVATEIAKTSFSVSVKENAFVNMVQQQEYKSMELTNFSHVSSNEAVTIMNSKDAMAKSLSFIDCNRLPFKDDKALSDVSESPVKFASRTAHCQCNTVLSSESDDERVNELPTPDNRLDFSNILSPDVSSVPASQTGDYDNHFDLNVDLMDQSAKHEPCQPSSWNLETVRPSDIFGICKSLDASCIPESNLVPGTESSHEPGFFSSTLLSSHFCVASNEALVNSAMQIHQSPEIGHGSLQNNKIDFKMHLLNRVENSCLLHEESVHGNEELQDLDSGNAHFLTRECQLMDECSRADFSLGMSKEIKNSFEIADQVQDTWQRLRNQRDDLKSYISTDKKGASQILKYSSGMTSVISDTDIMLSGCGSLFYDCMETLLVPYIEPVSISWCDEQLEMASTFAQHGLCFYVNKSKNLESELGKEKPPSLAQEMLVFSNSTMALGKLLSQENTASEKWCTGRTLPTGVPSCDISLIREAESKIFDAVLPIVPERLCLVIKGHAFHEYSSFLSLISKTENARLLKGIGGQQRRRRTRAALHYLKSCPLALSSNDVALLAQYFCFGGAGFG